MIREKRPIVILLILGILFIYFIYHYKVHELIININESPLIQSECYRLYKKLRYPDPKMIIVPPPKEPPVELRSQFEQNGDMPITSWLYFNNYYPDASLTKSDSIPIISKDLINSIIDSAKKGVAYGSYGDTTIQYLFDKYKDTINGKSCVVIGTENPWIEALAYMNNASYIVTLDYTRRKYETPNMNWLHVNDYYDVKLKDKKFEEFDFAASFSSIEHSGLGRYGDPLSPDGDIEAVKQVHCMIKRNGLFFLGLYASHDNSSFIQYNAHRVYGTKRLNLLFKGWKLLEQVPAIGGHKIYLLQKL